MIDKSFKLIVITVVVGFVLILLPLVLYLFILQPLQLREGLNDTYPKGAYVLVNKLGAKFGSLSQGDAVAFISLESPDMDEVGFIEKIEQENIFIEDYFAPIEQHNIIGTVMFCYSGCK